MYHVFCSHSILTVVLIWALAGTSVAGEPSDQIKQTTDKIISILVDPDLKDPSRSEERSKLVRKAADERFDWQEMARRALARHWKPRTDEERREFVPLFADLLERTYMKKIQNYSGEAVDYLGDRVEGKYGIVKVKISTAKNLEIPVLYRVREKGGVWLIYDVSIEGVSLVNNYRTQFNSIILNSSYEELVQKLKKKVSKKRDLGAG